MIIGLLLILHGQSFSAWPQTNHSLHGLRPIIGLFPLIQERTMSSFCHQQATCYLILLSQKRIFSLISKKAFPLSPSSPPPIQGLFFAIPKETISIHPNWFYVIPKRPVISHPKTACYLSSQRELLSLIPKGPVIPHPKRACYPSSQKGMLSLITKRVCYLS